MKKKKQSKDKKGKTNSKSPKEKEPNEKEIPKEIGTFHDFLVFEKTNKIEENNILDLSKLESDISLFHNLKNEPKPKESRFSNLFKEIIENDKKVAMEAQKEAQKEGKKEDKKEDQKEDKKEDKKEEAVDPQKEDNNEIKQNEEINKDTNKYNNNYFLYTTTFSKNKFDENNFTELNYTNTFFPNLGNFSQNNKMSITSNLSWPYGNSTNDTMFTGYTNSFSNKSKNSFDNYKNNSYENRISLNKNLNSINDNKNTINEKYNNFQDKIFEPIVNIKKVISLEDRRTTIMIKNIPNKFSRELLLSTIDQNFKGTYDLFILPTDGNRNKNFGYSFINFTSSYFIPYFYFMFNDKKWSSTNSKKICEITYSKVQGRANLISYYANKIIFYNNVNEITPDQKYIIPNDYKNIFVQLFPSQEIEEYKYYFITKMPNN